MTKIKSPDLLVRLLKLKLQTLMLPGTKKETREDAYNAALDLVDKLAARGKAEPE